MKAIDLTNMLVTGEKSPNDICPVLYSTSILGQKWKIPILWHLAEEGPLRYNELKRGIPLITNIMLTQSLRELEQSYLIERKDYGTIPPRVDYRLTKRGKTLIPILQSLHKWGQEQMEIVVQHSKQK